MADEPLALPSSSPQSFNPAGKKCDVRLYNIIILGLAFMFLFTAFQTASMAEKSVLDSAHNETNSTFTGDGYTSLGIIYAVFAVSNWAAPSVVALAGPKISMLLGGSMYFLFILSFLKPMNWALYLGSVLVGFGAGILWTAQGSFLTINSDSETVARNSGIFWALLQCSLLFGNIFTYFTFKGSSDITTSQRTTLFIGLSAAAALGVITMFLFRNKRQSDTTNLVTLNASIEQVPDTPLQAFKRALHLMKTKEMLLLSVTFAYTGIELTFFSGVYGTCIANTHYFGENANSYLGISGMFIGVGEIIGGAIFGLFGSRTNRYGRDPIVLLGYVVHMVAFFLIFINIPERAPLERTSAVSYITPSIYVAIVCSTLLGFGDSSYNTQIYSILGSMFPEDSAPAFALYKFVQSVAAAVGFYYSLALVLQWQLLILVVMGTAGSLSFFVIEWQNIRMSRAGRAKNAAIKTEAMTELMDITDHEYHD